MSAFMALVLTPVATVAHPQPPLALQFETVMHAGQGYGHNGDGCLLAQQELKANPVISHIWFDKPGSRLAQTNVQLRHPDPQPNLTFIGLFDEKPPTEIDIDDDAGKIRCETEPLPPTFCKNGSRVCPQTFGDFGSLNAFTSVLGMWYYNTSFFKKSSAEEVWQFEWTKLTRIPLKNGTIVAKNVTRNYTYTLDAAQRPDGTRPLRRFQWTQSIPLEPALPIHRDCFIFDYTTGYKAGPIDPARWKAPSGVVCQNGSTTSAAPFVERKTMMPRAFGPRE